MAGETSHRPPNSVKIQYKQTRMKYMSSQFRLFYLFKNKPKKWPFSFSLYQYTACAHYLVKIIENFCWITNKYVWVHLVMAACGSDGVVVTLPLSSDPHVRQEATSWALKLSDPITSKAPEHATPDVWQESDPVPCSVPACEIKPCCDKEKDGQFSND